ncbi:Na/Pi cotransporter family protein [Acetonema longum]|uniref:Na/Pi-cotransporter II-related protein n=1 Tax=Acetonema longum DSM 6540 TaxID=1009370 RepID=F7NIM6_9FIRM|nr:Na/Pi symporter [Acetonema longum]EGO64090.1 Na/Pi-cotransporter II-related protein [Acetonema longum DSM 6540]
MRVLMLILIGIGLLLSGLFCMRFGLKQMLSHKIKHYFQQVTVTPWRGLLVGTAAAAIMQSSTAVSLITIGLVGAEYLTFYQSLGVILGANIGTCTTVQLMTLSISRKFLFPFLIFCIIIMLALRKLRYPALSVAGLGFILLGLDFLSIAVNEMIRIDSIILDLLTKYHRNPLYGIAAGVIITLIFQSSSAATGVLIVLAERGLIDMTTAAYIVYGNNIGSCISSVIVGAAAPLAAKRVAAAHIVLNILGVMIFLPVTHLLTLSAAYLVPDFPGQIALIHALFNILSSLIVLPFIRQYADFIASLIPK